MCGDVEKRVLAEDRIITLEDVLVVRIEPAAGLIRVIVGERVAVAVSVPGRVADSPAILDRDEMVRFLVFRRHHAGRPGVADRGVHRQLQEQSGRKSGSGSSADGWRRSDAQYPGLASDR